MCTLLEGQSLTAHPDVAVCMVFAPAEREAQQVAVPMTNARLAGQPGPGWTSEAAAAAAAALHHGNASAEVQLRLSSSAVQRFYILSPGWSPAIDLSS